MFWERPFAYLVRLYGPGQLWSEIKVFFLSRVIDINKHTTLCIRQVHSVIDVCPAALFWASGAISILFSRLTAYLQGVLIPRTELNYIWVKYMLCERLLNCNNTWNDIQLKAFKPHTIIF